MHTHSARYICLIFAIILITVLAALASGQFFLENINSDFLYGFEASHHLFQYHDIRGVNFPIAPYYFPDMLLVAFMNQLTTNLTVLHFIYAVLFLATYTFLVYRLIRQTKVDAYLATFGAMMALLLAFLILPPGMPLLREWTFSHLSVMLFSLFLLSEYIKYRETGVSALRFILLGLFTYAVLISDNLLVVQLLIPFSIMVVFDLATKRIPKKNAFSLLLLFMVTVLVSAKTPDFMHQFLGSSESYNACLYRLKNLNHLGDTFQHALQLFENNIHDNLVFYAMILLYNLATLLIAGFLYQQNKGLKGLEIFTRIVAFLSLAQVCNVFFAVLIGKITETAHFRYLDIIYLYPAILLSICLSLALQRKMHSRFMAFFIGCLISISAALFVIYNPGLLSQMQFNRPYNATLQCLDNLQQQYGLQNGVAEYWNVRTVRMLSKRGLHISQVNAKLQLKNFIDARRHFYADDAQTTPLNFQFILTDHLSTDTITQAMGKPDRIASCGNGEVWLYLSKTSNARLNQFFAPQFEKLT